MPDRTEGKLGSDLQDFERKRTHNAGHRVKRRLEVLRYPRVEVETRTNAVDRFRPATLAKRVTCSRFERDDEDSVTSSIGGALKVLPVPARERGQVEKLREGKAATTCSFVNVGLPSFPSSVSFFFSKSHRV